jgi:hypothetical protein
MEEKKIIDLELETQYTKVQKFLSQQQGMTLDLQSIIYIVGLRELGRLKPLSKDEKIDLMHVATCRLLEPFGYYQFIGLDEDLWPHFEKKEELPNLTGAEQERLFKEAIVLYFAQNEILA